MKFHFTTRNCFHFLLFLSLLSGCAQLPDYAAPKILSQEPESYSFPYRRLTKDDFRGAPPDDVSAEHRQHIRARSSIQIRPSPTTTFTINRSMHNGTPLYWGNIKELSFNAFFIPEYSWWNPSVKTKNEEYVLQHEQIHFALMEISARTISRKVRNHKDGLPVIGESPKQTKQLLHKWLHDIIERHEKEILAEHTEFDLDTSLLFMPEKQEQWWDNVQERLRILETESSPGGDNDSVQR